MYRVSIPNRQSKPATQAYLKETGEQTGKGEVRYQNGSCKSIINMSKRTTNNSLQTSAAKQAHDWAHSSLLVCKELLIHSRMPPPGQAVPRANPGGN